MSGKIMMEELRDPTRIREGDLLLWPAETGKVNHLHGSASTMRKLGFSVGRRCGAVKYDQLKILQDDPTRPRFLVVLTKMVYSMDSTELDDALLIERPTDAKVKHVTVSEIPISDLKDGEYDLRAWALSSYGSLLHYAYNAATLPTTLGFYSKDTDKFLAQAIEDRVSWEWRSVEENFQGNLRLPITFGERTGPMKYSDYEGMCFAVSCPPRAGHTKNDYQITIPATVLSNAARYGMKAFRLTEEGKRAIGVRYARYYASMAERRYHELYGYVTNVYLRIGKDKNSLEERSKKFGVVKRVLARSNAKAEKEVCDVLDRK